MTTGAKRFFRKVGNSIGKAGSSLINEAGKATGKVVGGAVGAGIVEYAPLALTAFKTGGLIRAPKGRPVPILAHGQEYVLPVGVKPTKAQKKAVAQNKRKAKK
jgi:hypothetical protein